MNDERAVEAIAKGFYAADDAYLDTWDSQPEEGVKEWYRDKARAALAALRAEGYDLYRPDEFFLVPSKAQEDPDFEMPPPVGGEG